MRCKRRAVLSFAGRANGKQAYGEGTSPCINLAGHLEPRGESPKMQPENMKALPFIMRQYLPASLLCNF